MKELNISLTATRNPKYQRLAEALREAIRTGKVKPGEQLPSTRDMARRFQMHRHTVMQAFAELESEGWILAHPKRHYEITKTLPTTFLQPKTAVAQEWRGKLRSYSWARPLGLNDYQPRPAYKFAFPSGFPDLRLFPMREFKSYVYDALHSKSILDYGDPIGHPRLLNAVGDYLRRVRNVSDRSLVITNGSQEALFLLAQLLIRPGDAVAVEALGYPPALEALRFAGAKLVPIPVDGEGLMVEELERTLKKNKIRLLYTTPLHQYPTTVTLSAERRLRLYELACRHKIFILEDDYDHEFHYASQPVAPLASFDPARTVLYVSTFSKILFPSARLGFMAVPPKVAKEIAKLKRISSRQNEPILQEAVARWMEDGGFERHLRRMRRTYEERRNAMLDTLEVLRARHKRHEMSWIAPDGGMALWMDVGQSSKRVAAQADQENISINPELRFRLDGRVGTHIRLGFSGQTPDENRRGLEALFSIL